MKRTFSVPASAMDSHIGRKILTTQIASSVGGGFSIERAIKAYGAPPEAVMDSLKIISGL